MIDPFDIMDGGTSEVSVSCPECGYEFDRTTGVGPDAVQPEPGSWNVCFRCAALSIWTADPDGKLTVRAVRKGERVPDDVREVSRGLAEFRKVNPHRTLRSWTW